MHLLLDNTHHCKHNESAEDGAEERIEPFLLLEELDDHRGYNGKEPDCTAYVNDKLSYRVGAGDVAQIAVCANKAAYGRLSPDISGLTAVEYEMENGIGVQEVGRGVDEDGNGDEQGCDGDDKSDPVDNVRKDPVADRQDELGCRGKHNFLSLRRLAGVLFLLVNKNSHYNCRDNTGEDKELYAAGGIAHELEQGEALGHETEGSEEHDADQQSTHGLDLDLRESIGANEAADNLTGKPGQNEQGNDRAIECVFPDGNAVGKTENNAGVGSHDLERQTHAHVEDGGDGPAAAETEEAADKSDYENEDYTERSVLCLIRVLNFYYPFWSK